LTRARRTQQRHQFAVVHFQVHPPQRLKRAKALRYVSRFDAHDRASISASSPSRTFARMRASNSDLAASVSSANRASRLATANAATKLYSLYRISTCSGIVLVLPRMCPDTTETAPNSPIARALHSTTPYSSAHFTLGSV